MTDSEFDFCFCDSVSKSSGSLSVLADAKLLCLLFALKLTRCLCVSRNSLLLREKKIARVSVGYFDYLILLSLSFDVTK